MKTFGQTLKKLRQDSNMTIEELALNLNKNYGTKLSKSSISRWENSDADPKLEFVRILTDFFKVDSSLFFGNYTVNQNNELEQIKQISSQLNPSHQQSVLNYAKARLEKQNTNKVSLIQDYKIIYNNKLDTKIPFKRIGSTGAGVGEDLCDDMIEETVYFDSNAIDPELIESADFCIYVNGDSMEPAIKRGSYAFIRKTSELRNGLIALVIYEGTVLIKKIDIQDDCINLISLNPKYKTIKVEPHHQFKLIGKIVQ